MSSLADHLRERVRVVSAGTPGAGGELVLYWMHHAVRAHENPALDVAVEAAAGLGRPLLVYQGLGGRHRFNSDRHHTFILEGARDAARELRRRGIRHVFHLATRPSNPSPLAALAERAVLVVTEDLPVPPYTGWTAQLAKRIRSPVWAVDAACVVPMQSLGRSFERAFQFRRHVKRTLGERLGRTWPASGAAPPSASGLSLPFEPLDLERCIVAEICARCEIDHSVPPVSHTRGGSREGYRRWQAFLEEGLSQYHRRRRDATVAGTSRLSAYLHHGQVSPFRIAREALAHGSDGSLELLDQLVIWRELAHNYCFHRWRDVERLEALPSWALETLEAHASDPREQLFDWETLARGETGNRLWDAAQKSLLIHGELHNDVRMTWAKALLGWTRNPREALALLIDLNHRYALDGSDPSSYGGILWALGLFDRPFTPERPILGRVRPRPLAAQARRLDLPRYETVVWRPPSGRRLRIAVIGAGIAGSAAARLLHDQGHRVTLFDKARGVGGRASRRRQGELEFDHGAQYFTARDDRFRCYVDAWLERGLVRPWHARFAVFDSGRLRSFERASEAPERFVALPGMSALAGHLSTDLDVQLRRRIDRLELDRHGRWLLRDEESTWPDSFDWVVVSAPAPQAADLLRASAPLEREARGVSMSPAWAVMLAFPEPLHVELDAAFVNGGPLSWIARNSSKPGRRPTPDTWVLHGSPEWSLDHLEAEPEAVTRLLTGAFTELLVAAGAPPPRAPIFVEAHRWRHAQPLVPLRKQSLLDRERRIAVCGDWCAGPRIEGAFLSGMAVAGRILGHLATDRELSTGASQLFGATDQLRLAFPPREVTGDPRAGRGGRSVSRG